MGEFDHDLTATEPWEYWWVREIITFYDRKIQVSELSNLPRRNGQPGFMEDTSIVSISHGFLKQLLSTTSNYMYCDELGFITNSAIVEELLKKSMVLGGASFSHKPAG